MKSAAQAHPAQYSPEILDAIAPWIDRWRLPVHDPFAGTGIRLGQLCNALGLEFSGTELEEPYIVDNRVKPGDSTRAYTYPLYEHVIVTSPVYPNGCADHFEAKDGSRRHTYRQALAEITGQDRPLHPRNMGRYSARSGRKALDMHFDIARHTVCHWWPANALVNVSDFIMNGERFDVVGRWKRLLESYRYVVTDEIKIPTRRRRDGANAEKRVDHEVLLVAIPQV